MRRFLAFLLPLVLALVAEAQSPAFVEARAGLKKALVGRLNGLAGWCAEKQLYQERDKVWRQVLELDVDNPEARKGLRFARTPDGAWKEPAPRPAQNLNKAALAELPGKRVEALAPFRDGLLAALAAEPDAARLARSVHAELLQLEPDDAVVRGLRGEVRDGAQWVLGETVRGRARRAELRALVEQALAAPMELAPAVPEANERAWADAWSCGTRAPHVRVL
ncbi:MAG: hypothetical protein HZA53_11500, partial [Planctomycetes bacterium]|nr:hypothetical protein [Planctomycetota bacterium]